MGNCIKTKPQYTQPNSRLRVNTNQKEQTNPYDDDQHLFKIVMVGNSSVGKSAFVSRVARNEFSLEMKSTIGVDFCVKHMTTTINNKIITSKLQLWDTAGQDRYRAITSSYYRNAHCVLAMFSIADKESFCGLARWIHEVQTNSPNVLLVVIGTKKDLEHYRQVNSEEAMLYAQSCNATYHEISALENKGCEELIKSVTLQLIKKNINSQPKPVDKCLLD